MFFDLFFIFFQFFSICIFQNLYILLVLCAIKIALAKNNTILKMEQIAP